jgi:hypothetical protein
MGYRKSSILLVALIIVSFLIRISIALTNVETLLEKILIDDSFYEFSIAKNIAYRNFGTYNGFDKTNSIHPLWILLISLSFLLTQNIYLAVNIILIFASVIDIFTLVIIFKFTNNIFGKKTAFMTSMLYGLNPFVFFQTLSGMEVVLNVFFIVLVFYCYYLFKKKLTLKRILILSLIIGLSMLARADNLLLLIAICLHNIWEKRHEIKLALIECFIMSLVSLLVFSPLPIWNLSNFGKITLNSYIARYNMNHGIFPFFDLKPPKSLNDHLKLIIENTYRGLGIILHHFGVINFEILSSTVLLPLFIVVILLLSLKNLKILSNPILYVIIIFCFYCFYFLGVQIRYFTPFIPFLFMLFALGLQNFCKKLGAKDNLLYVILFSYIFILFLNGIQQWNQGYFSWQKEIYKDALWLRENTSSFDVIGCFSSGIPTYFSERRVINMDGVLNGEAIEAIKNKSVIAYMKSKNITIWIDSVYYNQSVATAYKNGLRFSVLEKNLWQDILGSGKENITLIEQREGIYRHLRGFEMLVIFFKARVL